MVVKDSKAEWAMLCAAYISIFNCMLRSDYNLVILLICYFFWAKREHKVARVAFVVMTVLIISEIFDIVWFIIVWDSWTGSNWSSEVWNNEETGHLVVLITSIVNSVVKLIIILFVYLDKRKDEENQYKRLYNEYAS